MNILKSIEQKINEAYTIYQFFQFIKSKSMSTYEVSVLYGLLEQQEDNTKRRYEGIVIPTG